MIRQLFLALATPLLVAPTAFAQQSTGPRTTVRSGGVGAAFGYDRFDGDRLVLGLSTSSGGVRDTLGLLVTSIVPGGPAEKAGLEEGNRLVSINGVALKLNASDAADPEMAGVLGRRFQRELEKAKTGEVVRIGVYANGQTREVRITPVRADELSPSGMSRSRLDTRSTIGASLGGFSSPRDTLGVFIVSVAEDGPLAKAGIYEGSRIAAINGVDLRVPAADIGDEFMTSARIRRLTREVEKLEAGANAELRVHTNGQLRTVTVKTVKRSDLKRDNAVSIFQSRGAGGVFVPPMELRLDTDGMRFEMEHLFDAETRQRIENALRGADIDLRRRGDIRRYYDGTTELRQRPLIRQRSGSSDETMPVQEVLELLEERLRDGVEPARFPFRSAGFDATADVMVHTGGETVPGEVSFIPAVGPGSSLHRVLATPGQQMPGGEPGAAQGRSGGKSSFRVSKPSPLGAVFTIEGIRMSPINANLAGYLGRGSERGLLVLEIGPEWTGVLPGDVLLSIDGKAVRDGDGIDVGVDADREHCVELLREGAAVKAVLRRR